MSASDNSRTRGSGTQNVYSTLRHEILSMALEPGSPLDEVRLSERFGMSRTPVREALLRLASDGLVTTLPNRNTIVSIIDFAALPTYFDALSLMYRITTRAAAEKRGGGQLAEIRKEQQYFHDAVVAHDALAMIDANREFHVAIAVAGGNPYYINFFTRLLDEGRRILRLYYSTFNDHLPKQYVDEHELMIAAIEQGDVVEADRLAIEHAAQIVRQIQDYIAREMGTSKSIPI